MAQSHILTNGYTFMAITTGHYGAWAKATDPITAARNAANENGYGSAGKVAVQVFFGKSDDMRCSLLGGIMWNDAPPTPVGLFLVLKAGSIKPMPKGAFNKDHESHDEWMVSTMANLKETLDEQVA